MKKLFTVFTISLLCFCVNSNAANFAVSGASDPNENGTYIQSGTINTKPYYALTNGQTYYIAWSGSQWQLGAGCCGGNIFSADCYNNSTSATCPTAGWSCAGLTVGPPTDALSYSTKKLVESINNDGTLPGVVTISLTVISNGQDFTGADGEDYASDGKIIFSNVPAGLMPHAIKTDTAIAVSFAGAAISSTHADDGYITLQFVDSAFALDTAVNVMNHIDSVDILFRQQFTVASSGADFTTVAGAIAAASDYDIISISGETFTEAGLTVNSALVFKGQGANQTIIQAASGYNTATDRVFNVSATFPDSILFYDLTIRNGKVTAGNGQGAGINAACQVNIYRCAITDNIAISSGGGSTFGGGVYCNYPLKIYASLISGNTATSVSGNSYGGGTFSNDFYMVNSTVQGNYAVGPGADDYGGGIYSNQGVSDVINCTIYGNSANAGGGIVTHNSATLNLINTITYGDTGIDVSYYNGGTLNASNCIIGALSTAAINGTNYNVSTADPLLSPLANNGGTTETMAVNVGSFAINEGATGPEVPVTDQRGYYENGIRDIGAYEYDGLNCIPTTDTAAAAICNGDSIFLGGAYQKTANTYYDTLHTAVGGCDSVIVTRLTINRVNITGLYAYICSGDSIFLGGAYQTIANTYFDQLTNVFGCDSVIITDLIVNPIDTTTGNASICSGSSYPFYGAQLTVTGTYYHPLTSGVTGCDSIIAVTLTVDTLDLTLTLHSDTVTPNQPNATSYQWIDCNNGNATLSGEVHQSYIATQNGSYAVIITNGACSDTSACQPVIVAGVNQFNANKGITVYPNPASTILMITNITSPTTIRLYDILGNLVLEEKIAGNLTINTSPFTAGAYTLVADDGKTRSFNKVVITK